MGFTGGLVVKNLSANAEDVGSIPEWVTFPGEGNGNALQYSCLGNPRDRGGTEEPAVYSLRDHKELNTTEEP